MRFVTGNFKKFSIIFFFLFDVAVCLLWPPPSPIKIRNEFGHHRHQEHNHPAMVVSGPHKPEEQLLTEQQEEKQNSFILIFDPNDATSLAMVLDNAEGDNDVGGGGGGGGGGRRSHRPHHHHQLPSIIIKYGPEFYLLANNSDTKNNIVDGNESSMELEHDDDETNSTSMFHDLATTNTGGVPYWLVAFRSGGTGSLAELWPTWQTILIILYTMAALLSLSFNLLTIVVWFCGDRSLSHEIWHLLVNLSVADIGMSIFCIPFTYTNVMLQQWIFPHYLCPVVNFAQLCFVFVSIWTLTIISIDRYLGIVHPLYKFRYRKCTIVAVIWLLGIIFASSQLIVSRATMYMMYSSSSESSFPLYECIEVWNEELHGQIYTVIVFVLTFAIPVLIITFAYSGIWYHMNRHVVPGNPNTTRDSHLMGVKSKVFKMLATVIGMFVLCWFPIHLFNMLLYFVPSITSIESHLNLYIYYGLFFATHFLSMVHSLMNPIIYCFMSENFRRNLICLLRRCFLDRYFLRQRPRGNLLQPQRTSGIGNHTALERIEMAVHLTLENGTEQDKSTIHE